MELPMLMKILPKSDSAVFKSPMLLWYCHFFKKHDCLLPKGCARTSHNSTSVFVPVSYLQVMSCYWHDEGQIRHRCTSPTYCLKSKDVKGRSYQIISNQMCLVDSVSVNVEHEANALTILFFLSTCCRAATSVEQDGRIDRGSIAKTLFQ